MADMAEFGCITISERGSFGGGVVPGFCSTAGIDLISPFVVIYSLMTGFSDSGDPVARRRELYVI
jgi:hypothetical protein